VPRLGRICIVPKLLEVVDTETMGVTVEVLTDWMRIPLADLDPEDTTNSLNRSELPEGLRRGANENELPTKRIACKNIIATAVFIFAVVER
jgi:hypothetical protein